jgi:hypothetical protein
MAVGMLGANGIVGAGLPKQTQRARGMDPIAVGSALAHQLRGMRLIREVELRLSLLFGDGEIPGFIHLSIGQEAVAVGVAGVLRTDDTLASNHRGHGHGLELSRFFLEIMGRREGYCGGRGGSVHVADTRRASVHRINRMRLRSRRAGDISVSRFRELYFDAHGARQLTA